MEVPAHDRSLNNSDEEGAYCTPNQSQETEAAEKDATPDFKAMAPENSTTVTAIDTSPQTRSKCQPSKAHRHEGRKRRIFVESPQTRHRPPPATPASRWPVFIAWIESLGVFWGVSAEAFPSMFWTVFDSF